MRQGGLLGTIGTLSPDMQRQLEVERHELVRIFLNWLTCNVGKRPREAVLCFVVHTRDRVERPRNFWTPQATSGAEKSSYHSKVTCMSSRDTEFES